ncbi:MAG: ABC-type sugar transport system, permease component [Eubacterium sp.]|jgi:putative aldouronate transport system permease protein|nr:ABC-type sugar transport system, permease component [Eubacterium sp.]
MSYKRANKIFDASIILITVLAVLLCIIPVLNVIAVSLSSNSAILNGEVFLLPKEFTLEAYGAIFKDGSMLWSLGYTVILTAGYTFLAMVLTIFAAYALTKKRLKGRNIFLLLIVFTMYFSGGIIPDYLLIKNLNFLDRVWSLVLPGAVSAFNLIVLKSFFQTMPESLEESAILDGCTDVGVLFRIVLPLSKAALATISLYYAVGKWNSFQDALFYISNQKLYPLQLKLYQIVKNSQALDVSMGDANSSSILPESLKNACVVFATIPIVLVYPKLQKYFVSGVTIGAVKG